ncbi:MAG: hypothetical protein ABSG53_32715 [Thermoguttaceae bacterium]|jgi:hypothetical protein
MKGIHGLIVAAVLGVAGAAVNFYYLNTEAQKKDMIAFIGIKKGVIIGRGDRLTDDKLVAVEIPKNHVGNLGDYVFLWRELIGVKGRPVWRTLDSKTDTDTEGVLLLRSDVVEPPPKDLELGKGELAEGIIVPRNFTASLVKPGSMVSFRVATLAPPGPTPASKSAAAPTTAAASGTANITGAAEPEPKPEEFQSTPLPTGPSEIIGPFVVVSIGNRLSTPEAQKGAKIAPVQENVLNLRISKNVPGEEERFAKLWNHIQRNGPNSYSIQILGRE